METRGIKNDLIDEQVYKNLPSILKEVTVNFKEREKDIVLLSSLGVLSACLPNIKGTYDGHDFYPNLYTIIIAPPASGKGVMNYSRLLIEPIHEQIYSNSRAEVNLCEDENRMLRKAKKGENKSCPPLEVKVIPANISSAEMYSYLGASNHGVLIMESEAETMSNMLKNDWSNYSDVLCKAYHHEPISISRKMEKVFEYVKEPKLSMVLSGTPVQLQPLIKSKDSGLFSRFILYTFDEVSGFKNVFASVTKEHKKKFELAAKEVFELYSILDALDEPIEFQLRETQMRRLVKEFSGLHQIVLEKHPNSFLSNLMRHGTILFRICMILTVLRVKDFNNTLTCSHRDFLIALNIVKDILKHALIIHNTIEDGILSQSDEDLLFSLNKIFTRKQAIENGLKFDIPQRTVDDKLVQWRKKRAIIKIGHGQFKRILR